MMAQDISLSCPTVLLDSLILYVVIAACGVHCHSHFLIIAVGISIVLHLIIALSALSGVQATFTAVLKMCLNIKHSLQKHHKHNKIKKQ